MLIEPYWLNEISRTLNCFEDQDNESQVSVTISPGMQFALSAVVLMETLVWFLDFLTRTWAM